MKGRRVSLFAFLAGALFASGCGVAPLVRAGRQCPASPLLPGGEPGLLLLGATEGDVFQEVDTEAEDESPGPRGSGFTVRAGLFVIGAAEDITFNPSFSLGAAYELALGKAVGMELSAEYGGVSDVGGGRNSTLILLSAGARYVPGGGNFYLVGSGVMVMETFVDDLTDFDGSNVAPLLGVGAGVRPVEGKWDVRIGYSLPLVAGVPGIFAVSGGYAF